MTEQILFDVSPIRDGRSYITREVQAKQDNEVIFVMIASFHVHEPGFEFQRSPEELAALMDSQGLTHVTRAQDLIDGGQDPLQGGTPNTPRLQLFSGSNDGTVRIWGWAEGQNFGCATRLPTQPRPGSPRPHRPCVRAGA